MSAESEILADIELLKAKFTDTRVLYREACALLFFRYGITPTANKLYQYVRRGSMNVPTEEVGKFWDELRRRARVEIEHPDLPDAIKAAAAEAIGAIWHQASEAARGELAAARIDLVEAVEQSRVSVADAERSASQWKAAAEALQLQLAAAVASRDEVQAELEAERRAHAGAQARGQELEAQLGQARSQQQRQQEGFSADLAKAREAVETAQERASATEKRALLEIDQERQARSRADKTVESLRAKLTETEARERQQSLESTQIITRLQADGNFKSQAMQAFQQRNEALEREVAGLAQQLRESQQDVARYQAEAQAAQGLLARLTPQVAAEAPKRGSRRKAAGA
jgi:chromosome segregation ATPase